MSRTLSPHRIWLGREAELAELESGLRDLTHGRGGLFLVCGEPGIGKTRLADEIAQVARNRGVAVHWGRAWEAGGAPPFWIFVQLLRGISRALDRAVLHDVAGPHTELGALLPELASPGPGSHSADERFRLFEAVDAFLHAACASSPRLVVLDDLHAADPSSLQLLDFVVHGLRSKPLMLLGTFREAEARLVPEIAPVLARIAREACVLPLRRFDREQVADFIAQSIGDTPDAERVDAIHRSTEGIPLFVRELLQLHGSLARAPDSVREVIRARLSLLDRSSRELLEAAAVLGREFEVEPLAALTETPELEVRALIEPAARAGIVEALDHPPRWRFSHVLLREALHDALDDERRRSLHRAAADVLLQSVDAPLTRIAHHLFNAFPAVSMGRVAEAARHAAERAIELRAYEDGVALYGRACTLLREATGEEHRLAEAMLGLGLAQIRAADVELGKENCIRAADLAKQLGDGDLFARAVLAAAYEFAPWQRDEPLRSRLEEALSMLPHGDGALRARCMAQLAAERSPEPDMAPIIELARAGVAMARRTGDRATLRATLSSAGLAMLSVGDPDERLTIDREALRLALADGDLRLALRAHLHVSNDLAELGDSRGSAAHLRALTAMIPTVLHDRFRWLLVGLDALQATAEGRFDDAAAHLREAGERAREDEAAGGSMAAVPVSFALVAERYDDVPSLESRVRSAFGALRHELAGCVGEMFIAQLHGRVGDRLRARAQLAAVLSHPAFAQITEPSWLALLVEPCHVVGDVELADHLYASLLPRADRFLNCVPLTLGVDPPYARLLGLLARTLGRIDEAVDRLADAEGRVVQAGMQTHLARARYELAGALLARDRSGDRQRAIDLLASARAVAERLGQRDLLPLIAVRTAEAGPPRVGSARPPADALAFSLRSEGEYWTVTWGQQTLRLRDSRGLQVLDRLLATPGHEWHVLQLVSPDAGTVPDGDAGNVLDDAAVRSYRDRLIDLREDLDDAEAAADPGRAERARVEIEFLTGELARAVGLGGRARRSGSAAERARTTVQKRLRDAIRRIADGLPELGAHLDQTIHTGTFCGYLPRGRRGR